MRTFLITIISVLLSSSLFAQNAKSILDKAASTYNNAGGLEIAFTLKTEDTSSKTSYINNGTALIKGNKFKIEVPDGITWFDGKTQWVMLKGSDEVNVTNPTGEELAGISPLALLNIYKSGYNLNYKGEKTEKGKSVYVIEMIPQQKNADISKYVVNIDKSTNMFSSISIMSKDGTNNHLTIDKYTKKTNLPDSNFAFNKSQYPGVEVIDLR